MRIWLDDIRPAPQGWVWVDTVEKAIELMASGEVAEASLDHDLGDGEQEGYKLVLWMAENDMWPREAISVHSANPPGAKRMCGVIERYGHYRRVPGTMRFIS
jgi:hypothetical protein